MLARWPCFSGHTEVIQVKYRFKGRAPQDNKQKTLEFKTVKTVFKNAIMFACVSNIMYAVSDIIHLLTVLKPRLLKKNVQMFCGAGVFGKSLPGV